MQPQDDNQNEEDNQINDLVKKAAIVINPKIKRYKYAEIDDILNSEFPIDYPVTDTRMPCLSLACSLPEKTA